MKQNTTKYENALTLATIESVITSYFSPTFLHISQPDEDNDIHLIVSSSMFNYTTTQERIKQIMERIMLHIPDAYKDRLIIIQAYSSPEFEDVIDYVLDEGVK